MQSVVTGGGQHIQLGQLIGRGGEASVFAIAGDTQCVAKLYHNPVDAVKQQKLVGMSRLAQPDLLKFAAWPADTLHNFQGGPVVGITMPRICEASEVHSLYSPAHRKTEFPRADWRFLVHVALNSAIAFGTLHSRDIVVGDVNQGNVLVTQKGLVKFIDCDSFQLHVNGRLHRCGVGVAHFQPPEMQSAKFSQVVRTTNHDNFGLAVLIFHLLFLGRHPFSVKPLAKVDIPIEAAIKRFAFPYGKGASSKGVAPPPQALELRHVTPRVASLFERAFGEMGVSSGRPSANEWNQALQEMRSQLRVCVDDGAHYYLQSASGCPWCKSIRAGGVDFFVSASLAVAPVQQIAFDPARAWGAIELVRSPESRYRPAAKLSTKSIVPAPIPPTATADKRFANTLKQAAAFGFGLTFAGFVWFPLAIIGGLAFLAFGLLHLVISENSGYGKLQAARRRERDAAVVTLSNLQSRQQEIALRGTAAFQRRRADLRNTFEEYQLLSGRKVTEELNLRQSARERQLEAFLQTRFILPGCIRGVGPARVATLASFGIETAADIRYDAVTQIPGFGPSLAAAACGWREAEKTRFKFDPSQGAPAADFQALEHKYALQRAQLERKLRGGATALELVAKSTSDEVNALGPHIAAAEYAVAQSEANLSACR